MGNSNENICSCADDNQRISINTSSQIKIRPTFENDPIQLSANYNNDMGDNCHFFENNKSYQKQTNFNIEPSFHNSKIKRQITFGNDFQNNNYNEKPNRLSNLPKQIDKTINLYDFNNSKNAESSIYHENLKFSENHERELELIKAHLKKNDSTPEQKFKEVSKVPIYFSEINLKNMTANKKELLWKHYIIKLPDNDEIIYEGELLKYKPGMNFNYIKRWCQLTPKYFKYYKDKLSAKCWDTKPLFTIDVSEIKAAYKVKMDLPIYKVKKTIANYPSSKVSEDHLFEFEIFLYNDFPKVVTKKEELELFTTGEAMSKNKNKNHSLYKNLSEKSFIGTIQKGHLMPKPRDLSQTIKKNNMSLISKEKSEIDYSGYEDFQNMFLSNYDIADKTNTQIKFEEMTYCWSKPITELLSWTSREKEWYFSEKRLLFASQKVDVRDSWFNVLNIFLKVLNNQ